MYFFCNVAIFISRMNHQRKHGLKNKKTHNYNAIKKILSDTSMHYKLIAFYKNIKETLTNIWNFKQYENYENWFMWVYVEKLVQYSFFTPQKCIHVPLNRNSNTPPPFFFFRMQVPLTMTLVIRTIIDNCYKPPWRKHLNISEIFKKVFIIQNWYYP